MAQRLELTELNTLQKTSEAWLRKYRAISKSDRVEHHEHTVLMCKLARKTLTSADPSEMINIRTVQLEEGERIYNFLNNPANFADKNKAVSQVLYDAKFDINHLSYEERYHVGVPTTAIILGIVYRTMHLAAAKA